MSSTRSRAWTAAVVPIALLAALALGSCRRGAGGSSTGVRPLTLAVVPMGTTHEFWKAIHAGALTAAREQGVEIIWKGPLKEDDRNEQIQIVETLTNAGIDALVLTPMDDKALVRPVEEAARLGIPTVIYNSGLSSAVQIATISTDNYRGGAVAADRIGELLKGRGTVILIRVIASVEGSTKREQGFLDTLRSKYPNIEILSDNQYAGVTTETAYQTAENLLNRFPQVDALFTPNESTTFGALRAIEDHGRAGRMIHVGFDSSSKLIEALEAGRLMGLVLQDPFQMGYRSVSTAVAHLRGQPYQKAVDTGVFLATPENRSDPLIGRLLKPDLSILD
jgi:ribose transport system substrate-binding protein